MTAFWIIVPKQMQASCRIFARRNVWRLSEGSARVSLTAPTRHNFTPRQLAESVAILISYKIWVTGAFNIKSSYKPIHEFCFITFYLRFTIVLPHFGNVSIKIYLTLHWRSVFAVNAIYHERVINGRCSIVIYLR